MKVIVYQYIGSYGGGLLFLSDECEQEQKWISAQGYSKKNRKDMMTTMINLNIIVLIL